MNGTNDMTMSAAPKIAPPSKNKARRKSLLQRMLGYRYVYLLLLPGIVTLIVFNYFPMYGIQLAFKNFRFIDGIWGSPWVGFDNFTMIFSTPGFMSVLKNTLIISVMKLITGYPVPIILCLLLNELKSTRFKKVTQTVLYLPHFLSWVIIAGLIYNIFSATGGLYGKVFRDLFQSTPTPILTDVDFFRPLLYISSIWKSAGWNMIIFLAAIAGIDPGLYESAALDGANRFQKAIYITLPSLAFAISITLILSLGGIMSAGFDQVFNLYSPQVYAKGDIIDTYIFRLGVGQGRFDVATAIGLFNSVVGLVLILLANKIAGLLGDHAIF